MAPRTHSPDGTIRLHRRFLSRELGNARELVVWLPPGCDGRIRRHPVAYFHDGQNVFDPATAFFGNAWHAGEAAAGLIRAGVLEPTIMVGIYNAGAERIHEYAPTRGEFAGADGRPLRSRGQLRRYSRFVADEVVPFIDARYPTLRGPEHRASIGSSMGGLAALYGALWHRDVFAAAAALSPSIWWDELAVVVFVQAIRRKPAVRLWLDTGTAEPAWENARQLRAALLSRGWRDEPRADMPADLRYREVPGAGHHESAWAARVGEVLAWLFPAR